ncbi:MAG: 5-oxoprolinase subunit PxpA [Flavobacteriaceae bacterium]
MKATIDLNCDLGEGTGNDLALMPYLSSCSIACGGHYGNQKSIKTTLTYAAKYGVKTGAHPSYYDRDNFGRRSLAISLRELQDSLRQQLDLFYSLCTQVSHVKPHGALYNDLYEEKEKADAVVEVIKEYDPKAKVFCAPGSQLFHSAHARGLHPVLEGFGDRAYRPDGGLVARQLPQAVHHQKEQITQQVLRLIQQGEVVGLKGEIIPLKVATICLHGDGDNVVENLAFLAKTLVKNKIHVSAV